MSLFPDNLWMFTHRKFFRKTGADLMTADRWNKIKELFSAAQALPDAERENFLRQSCAGDPRLLDEVRRLLDSDLTDDSFLQHSAAADFADLFRSDLKDDNELLVSTDSPPRFESGDVLNGRYQITRLLGRGGMGEVYLATDIRINRNVALKVLHPDLVSSKESLRRFALEAQAVSALNHPHIVTIHDFETTDDGTLFIVTEYVEGKTLNRLIGDGLDLDKILEISIQAASALSAAHEAGITHRDIKPENVMVRRDGYIKVLDFGLAKLTQRPVPSGGAGSEDPTRAMPRTKPGMIVGTAAYMSPEQARGLHVDARTDVWSLGAVLYEMLTGRRPFSGETQADVIVAVLLTEPPPLSDVVSGIPAELQDIVSRALSKDVAGRYSAIDDLRADLEKLRKRVDLNHGFVRSGSAAEQDLREAATMISAPDGAVATAGDAGRTTAGPGSAAYSLWSSPSVASFYEQARTHKLGAAIGALIFVGLLTAGGYFALGPRTAQSQMIDSIAVLPFENRSGNAELNYVSDGMSEALIDRLSQLPQLKVISRSSSFKFREPGLDPVSVASQLGVRAVVTGSVEQVGEDISIRFDIIDTTENAQVAGGQYRRKASDLLSLRNDIAQTAYEKLRLKLTDSQTELLSENGTENSEAYRYYLNGLVELNSTQDVRGNALDYFERAVSLDPSFAAAYAEIGWVQWGLANQGGDPQKVMPKASAAAERALALDPNLAKAHVVRAVVHEYEFDWAAAEAEYKRAIELSPNLDFARNNYAFFLSVMDRPDEALAQLEEQRIRDPLNRRLLLLQKGIILTQARRFDDALRVYQEAQAVEPSREIPNFSLGYAYGGKGLYNEAAGYYRRSSEIVKGEQAQSQPLAYLAAVYAKTPDKVDEARRILAKIEGAGHYSSPAILAVAYAALGENDRAISKLEQAYIKRDVLLRYIGTGYEYDNLRTDGRFIDLMKRIGLAK
ncbi:MAG TPA: protein kinase [Pyrinomonadaceae bacterium]|nr:protein kinase [Pyrinomonadaceae bacterium]